VGDRVKARQGFLVPRYRTTELHNSAFATFICSLIKLSHLTEGYCWPTYFKILGVLFLGEVSSTFLPSKKACWAHQCRYLGVGQQYPEVFETQFNLSALSELPSDTTS
jgi:hypothetical protein